MREALGRSEYEMKLFSDITREDSSPAAETEPLFAWLDRSADGWVHHVRAVLEEWFAKYPEDHQAELRSRIRDTNDMLPGFLELYVHELLLRLGYRVVVHPELPEGTRRPDFRASCGDSDDFYVEATLVTGASDRERSQKRNLDALFEALHRLDSPDFFLDMDIHGLPPSSVPGRKWRGQLREWLQTQDYAAVEAAENAQDVDRFPSLELEHDGFRIVFRPFTKKKARGKPGISPLGTFGYGVESVDHITPLKKSLAAKANQFGPLDLPLVVIADVLEIGTDELDVMQALFGTQRFHIPLATCQDPSTHTMTWDPDGLWHAPWGPRYTRVSAVIVFVGLRPWTVASVEPCVYHNPWAEVPCQGRISCLTQRVPDAGQMELVSGTHPRELLELAEEWPRFAAP